MVDADGDDGGKASGNAMLQEVPLVRTEGKRYTNGAVWSVDLMLRDPRLLREYRDDIAREAERAFGHAPSLYFYVGHACPSFASDGNAFVFVFAANTFDASPGTVTHFDTGGFYKGAIHLDRDVDINRYVADHRIDSLAGWRAAFGAYVKEYFDSASAYVRGDRARKRDPYGRMHHANNERRAWTWEVQLHVDHDVRRGLSWLWLTSEARDRLVTAVAGLRGAAEKTGWQDLIDARVPAVHATDERTSLCRHAEKEIVKWL